MASDFPETFRFIGELTSQAHALGMEVLVEIHSYYKQQIQIAQQVDWVYDFALPPLVLHSLFAHNAEALARWLSVRPQNCVTVLDTHDGIGVIDVGAGPDGAPGLLAPADINRLVETIHARSHDQSRMATGAAANNLDLYQVNCTFYDALGRDDNQYLLARAIQFFAPGIPQVYYVGLLGGTNDMDLLARSRVGRDINRHYYTEAEIEGALRTAVVSRLLDLMRLRNTHPAFGGEVKVEMPSSDWLAISWTNGEHWTKLDANLSQPRGSVTYSDLPEKRVGTWDSQVSPVGAEALR